MNPIAQIFAKTDGTLDIAALPMDPRQLVNILLSLASAIVNRMSVAPTVESPQSDVIGIGTAALDENKPIASE